MCFLLGGQDLEMKAIRALLERNAQPFVDLGLAWGAALSAYKDVMALDEWIGFRFAGIELKEDMPPPPNYLRIDHHDDLVHKPAAIVQVAELIGVELSRYELLVATNDALYIPGLVAAGATEDEIAAIRLADRKAQGVTTEDERLAEESILHHLEQRNGLSIIHAQTARFSPIMDRLHGKADRVLVWRENELTYYHADAEHLAARILPEVPKGQLYIGGSGTFFGMHSVEDTGYWIKRIIEEVGLGH